MANPWRRNDKQNSSIVSIFTLLSRRNLPYFSPATSLYVCEFVCFSVSVRLFPSNFPFSARNQQCEFLVGWQELPRQEWRLNLLPHWDDGMFGLSVSTANQQVCDTWISSWTRLDYLCQLMWAVWVESSLAELNSWRLNRKVFLLNPENRFRTKCFPKFNRRNNFANYI